MKKQYLLLLMLILSNISYAWCQNQLVKAVYTVAAPSGLIVRQGPSTHSEKLGKFPLGEHVELIENTGKKLSIRDNGIVIQGSWFKVKRMQLSWDTTQVLTGYVFSGYLLRNESRPYNPANATAKTNSILEFENFKLTISFYNIENSYDDFGIVKNDTMHLYEEVFNDIDDKLIYIEPKVKTDKVELFYTLTENIWEYGYEEDNPNMYRWKGSNPFKKLPLTRNMALFPKVDYEKIGNARRIRLKLRDTLVHFPGEMGGTTCTMSHDGKPCVHFIPNVILKVILYRTDGTIDIKYVDINLSYGC